MTPAARERSQVRAPILIVSLAAWAVLAIGAPAASLAAHCPVAMPGATLSLASLGMLLDMNPPAPLALGWTLMLAAMMGPMLIAPVRHVRDRSFVRRRARALALFVAGYCAIWMPAGAILMAIALAMRLAVSESAAMAGAAMVAIAWQCSPLKQLSLNRCHAHRELAAFGKAADLDALRFGLTHGAWCALSCSALMLLPLLFSRGHVAAMAAVSLWLFGERLERPRPPRWRLRGPVKAARIAIARAPVLAFR